MPNSRSRKAFSARGLSVRSTGAVSSILILISRCGVRTSCPPERSANFSTRSLQQDQTGLRPLADRMSALRILTRPRAQLRRCDLQNLLHLLVPVGPTMIAGQLAILVRDLFLEQDLR